MSTVLQDLYLQRILEREAVDTGLFSPVRGVQRTLDPIIGEWANRFLLGTTPSGSFAKGTGNKSGTDIDLFISLSPETKETLKQVYDSLFTKMSETSFSPKRQNVSINVRVNGYSVDLVPGRRQSYFGDDHSLYRRRADTWNKTNIQTHITHVVRAGWQRETRIIKLWRDQKGLDFPSFYLELAVIRALSGQFFKTSLATDVMTIVRYLSSDFVQARIDDPANTNNTISDELSGTGRKQIAAEARRALQAVNWNQIVL
jgi:hypothetical protein